MRADLGDRRPGAPRRRFGAFVGLVALTALAVAPAPALAASTTTTAPGTSTSKGSSTTAKGSSSTVAGSTTSTTIAPPKAWILVDLGTGAVLSAQNDRALLPPASLTKIVTALAAASRLEQGTTIPISARAAAQPANKVGVKAGEAWPIDDAMHELLMESANDLALAFAEAVGPNSSADEFGATMTAVSAGLGLQDRPVWRDPAGLDDEKSIGGGNLVSARDLAIAARALIGNPWLGSIVATPSYTYTAPDGVVHRADNHNKQLLSGAKSYPGSIGVKTGYTKKAGHTFIGAARRGERTLVAVVLNTPDAYGASKALLDEGFSKPGTSSDRLPTYRPLTTSSAGIATAASTTPPAGASVTPIVTPDAEGGDVEDPDASSTSSTPPTSPDTGLAVLSSPKLTTHRSGPSAPVAAGLGAAATGGIVALVVTRRRRRAFAVSPRRRRAGL